MSLGLPLQPLSLFRVVVSLLSRDTLALAISLLAVIQSRAGKGGWSDPHRQVPLPFYSPEKMGHRAAQAFIIVRSSGALGCQTIMAQTEEPSQCPAGDSRTLAPLEVSISLLPAKLKEEENKSIYNCIKNYKIPGNQINQEGRRPVFRKLQVIEKRN